MNQTGKQNSGVPSGDRDIEQLLSEPTAGAVAAMRAIEGDHVILGASGKMGVTQAVMTRRALDAAGRRGTRVFGVARFRDASARALLESFGVEPLPCDLRSYEDVMRLPEIANVQYLAGHKFGTDQAPGETWIENTVVPSHVARRFRRSRIVVFSTGCVYPLAPVESEGSAESVGPGFLGEYASTCIGRERVFSHYSQEFGTPVLLYRLNYSVEYRYGVLVDVGQRVWRGEPVDARMGAINVIWQREACARALQCLLHTASPAKPLNISGEKVSVLQIANAFGAAFGRAPIFEGSPQATAWHIDTRESMRLFGPVPDSLPTMVGRVADYLRADGRLLGKPTHFEVRDGKF